MAQMKALLEETLEEITKAGYNAQAFAIFLDNTRTEITEWDMWTDEFQESYQGEYSSSRDFYEDMADQSGLLAIEVDNKYALQAIQTLVQYFDFESWGRDLLLGGDYWERDGYYFRSN
jgi:antirestriction protein